MARPVDPARADLRVGRGDGRGGGGLAWWRRRFFEGMAWQRAAGGLRIGDINLISMWSLCREFLIFASREKKWWLGPLGLVLLGVGALMVFGSSSALAPLLYPFL